MSHVTISVTADRIKYVEGQSITISGTLYNESGKPVSYPVSIKVRELYKNDSSLLIGKTVYGATLIPNGTYSIDIKKGLIEGQTGQYNIVSYIPWATLEAYKITGFGTNSTTIISVENVFTSTAFMVLYVGGGIGFGGIIITVILGMYSARTTRAEGDEMKLKNDSLPSIYEMFQFIFITILAFTPIVAFALTDVELFPNSPIGIIIDPSENATLSKDEWKINIGGNSSDKYTSGIQVPVAIFIFGIAGGYMRYLFSQADKLPEIRKKIGKNTKQEDLLGNPIEVFYLVLQDVAFLFLYPLLAIAVWLVLFQGGTTSVLTLTAVSFVSGLVTKEVGKTLVAFAKRMLQTIDVSSSQNETTDKHGDSENENKNGEEKGDSVPTMKPESKERNTERKN
jgi:hypothetical protein